jgi:hypothetical protein
MAHGTDPLAGSATIPWRPLSQTASTLRLLLLIAALANPFCSLLCIATVQSALADMKTANVRGTVFSVDSNAHQSGTAGAKDPARWFRTS